MKKVMIMLGVSLAMAACKKSEVSLSKGQKMYNLSTIVVDSAANSANAYDSIGFRHNVLLGDVLSANNTATKQPSLTTITASIISDTKVKVGISLPVTFFDTVDKTVRDQQEGFKAVIGEAGYSMKVQQSVIKLLQLISDLGQDNSDYKIVKTAIMTYEAAIISDRSLSADERKILLSASSVARYSFYYWGHVNTGGQVLKMRNIVKWIAAVTSDVAGAAVSGNFSYAADCSAYAYDLVNYSMP